MPSRVPLVQSAADARQSRLASSRPTFTRRGDVCHVGIASTRTAIRTQDSPGIARAQGDSMRVTSAGLVRSLDPSGIATGAAHTVFAAATVAIAGVRLSSLVTGGLALLDLVVRAVRANDALRREARRTLSQGSRGCAALDPLRITFERVGKSAGACWLSPSTSAGLTASRRPATTRRFTAAST